MLRIIIKKKIVASVEYYIIEYGALTIGTIEEWRCICIPWVKKDKQTCLLWQLGIQIGALLPSSISSTHHHVCRFENV